MKHLIEGIKSLLAGYMTFAILFFLVMFFGEYYNCLTSLCRAFLWPQTLLEIVSK
jgi:hypothetical protein